MWRARLVARNDELIAVLSADERERASRFYRPEDARAYAMAHAHLRHIIARYVPSTPESLVFAVDDLGKPVLSTPVGSPRIEFNLSHSGVFALVAVSLGRRVGVDVERWKNGFDYARLAARVFSPAEQAALAATHDEAESVAAFYAGWCRKEAYIKATGHGLARNLDHFDVTLATDDARLIADRLDAAAAESWAIHAIDVGLGYSAAVVVESVISEVLLFAEAQVPETGNT